MKTKLIIFSIIALCLSATPAKAAMYLKLDDGVSSVTLSDGDLDGVITYNSALGTIWTVNVTTGISKPAIGGPTIAELDLNSVNVSSSAGGTLTIMLTDTGFTLPPAIGAVAVLESHIGGTTNGTVQLTQILDRDNSEWSNGSGDEATLISPLHVPTSFSSTQIISAPVSAPFSLTEKVVITHKAGGITSFDAYSRVVPVPGAVLLGILGLSVAGIKLRRFA